MPGKKPDFTSNLTNEAQPSAAWNTAYGGIKLPPTVLSVVEWLRQKPNALVIDAELTEEEWYALIQGIETIQKRYQWYLGDAMVYGIDRKYGATDDQIQRIVELTGKAASTLHEYYKTALLFEIHERSENLDFEQHRVLAVEFSQDTPEHRAERLRWLHVAETGGMSGRKLKAEIEKAQLPAEISTDESDLQSLMPPGVIIERVDLPYPTIEDEAIDIPPLESTKAAKKTFNNFIRCVSENRLQDMSRGELYALVQYLQDKYEQRRKMGG